jgi:hypothetical protein
MISLYLDLISLLKGLSTSIKVVISLILRTRFFYLSLRKIAFKKPSKPDYSLPKAYRVISLLNCLGKISERILAQRLSYLAETTALLHPSQIGGRLKKSAIDTALLLSQEVELNKKLGKKTSTLFLDVKGAFDHVSKNQLLKKLKDLRLPTSLIAWISTFLTDRLIRLSFDGQIEAPQLINTGIP